MANQSQPSYQWCDASTPPEAPPYGARPDTAEKPTLISQMESSVSDIHQKISESIIT